eukprot:4780000-Prymnesium_polylepis.1
MHLSSLPTSLSPRRMHLLLFSASTTARRRSIPARPWTVAVQESSRGVAAWPHRRVQGASDLRHHKVRTPYAVASMQYM